MSRTPICPFMILALGVAAPVWGTVPAEVFFDDFTYESVRCPGNPCAGVEALLGEASWQTPEGDQRYRAWYSNTNRPEQTNIELRDSTWVELTLPAGAASGPDDKRSPSLATHLRFNRGTYAAVVQFDLNSSDDPYQAFWVQTAAKYGLASAQYGPAGSREQYEEYYAECDFEFRPEGTSLDLVTWERELFLDEKSEAKQDLVRDHERVAAGVGELAEPVLLLLHVRPEVVVYSVYDQALNPIVVEAPYEVSQYVPEADVLMGIFFNVWAETGSSLSSSYTMRVDWVLHDTVNDSLTASQVTSIVDGFRGADPVVERADTVDRGYFQVDRCDDPAGLQGECKPWVDEDCALRDAVRHANANPRRDYIEVSANLTCGSTFTLAVEGRHEDAAVSGDLDVIGSVEIKGERHKGTGSPPVIDGSGLDRVFDFFGGEFAVIDSLRVEGGNTGPPLDGDSPSATGGGIRNRAQLWVKDSYVVHNRAYHQSPGAGGGLINFGDAGASLRVSDSIIASNGARFGCGVGSDRGELILERSTVSSNGYNGPECDFGAGVSAGNAMVRIQNVTIARNRAEQDGGAMHLAHSNAWLNGVTIVENGARAGSAVYLESGSINIGNSIVDGMCRRETEPVWTSEGGGISTVGSGTCKLDHPTDTELSLAELQLTLQYDGSGVFLSHYQPSSDSPVKRHAGTGALACLVDDQSGESRSGSRCSAGSVEVGGGCSGRVGKGPLGLAMAALLLAPIVLRSRLRS